MPPERLVGPAVVIDQPAEAAADPDYLLTVDDLRAFEAEHGPLPEGGWLLLRTGWDARAQDEAAFLNADETGPHTPGFDVDCAAGWPRRGPSSASGSRRSAPTPAPPTPSTRRSPSTASCSARASTASPSWPTSRLPATGAVLIVAPLKLVGGTGSPARVLALTPRT